MIENDTSYHPGRPGLRTRKDDAEPLLLREPEPVWESLVPSVEDDLRYYAEVRAENRRTANQHGPVQSIADESLKQIETAVITLTEALTGLDADRLRMSGAAVLPMRQAASLLSMRDGDALRWLKREGLVRDLDGRKMIVWGDVVDRLRAVRPDGTPTPHTTKPVRTRMPRFSLSD